MSLGPASRVSWWLNDHSDTSPTRRKHTTFQLEFLRLVAPPQALVGEFVIIRQILDLSYISDYFLIIFANKAVGRGGHVIAGTVGYSFGQLLIPGYHLPWEDANLPYPSNLARPLQIAIEASDGASDYGNKFGEPVVCGFARSFGLVLPDQSRREWIKAGFLVVALILFFNLNYRVT